MLRPNRSKKKPPIEISNKDSTSTFSPPSPSPSLFRTGEKEDTLSLLLKKKTKNLQKRQ